MGNTVLNVVIVITTGREIAQCVGGKIYALNERGTCFVFKADTGKFQQISKNQLGDEALATPVICGGRVYLRVAHKEGGKRQEMLYCIGN